MVNLRVRWVQYLDHVLYLSSILCNYAKRRWESVSLSEICIPWGGYCIFIVWSWRKIPRCVAVARCVGTVGWPMRGWCCLFCSIFIVEYLLCEVNVDDIRLWVTWSISYDVFLYLIVSCFDCIVYGLFIFYHDRYKYIVLLLEIDSRNLQTKNIE